MQQQYLENPEDPDDEQKKFQRSNKSIIDDRTLLSTMTSLLNKLGGNTSQPFNSMSDLRPSLQSILKRLDVYMKGKDIANDFLAIRLCENSLCELSKLIFEDYESSKYARYWMFYFDKLLRHLLILYKRNKFSYAMITIYKMLITTMTLWEKITENSYQKLFKKSYLDYSKKNFITELDNLLAAKSTQQSKQQSTLLQNLMNHRGIVQRNTRDATKYSSLINHIRYLTILQKMIRDITLPDGTLPQLTFEEFKDKLRGASYSFPVIRFLNPGLISDGGYYPYFHIPSNKKLKDLYDAYKNAKNAHLQKKQ